MTSPSTTGRRAGLAAAACLVLGALVTGCGSSDEPTDGASSAPRRSVATASASPSASTSPTTSAAAAPLSKFEGDPAVRGARAWMAALARDVNNKDAAFTLARPLSTARAQGKFQVYEGEDLATGARMPGPQPFTPVSVQRRGGEATVRTCYWAQGWSRPAAGGPPTKPRSIVGASFQVIRSASGVWQVNAFYTDRGVTCDGVKVRGVRFE